MQPLIFRNLRKGITNAVRKGVESPQKAAGCRSGLNLMFYPAVAARDLSANILV